VEKLPTVVGDLAKNTKGVSVMEESAKPSKRAAAVRVYLTVCVMFLVTQIVLHEPGVATSIRQIVSRRMA
jgi:hypothetical protein